jgi:hypothetical protein
MLFLDEKSYSVGKYIRLKYDENGKLFVIHSNKPYFVKIMARGTEQECNKKAAALERILDTGHEDNNDDEEESEVNTSGSVSSDKENARESSINKKKALKLPKNQSHASNVDSSKKLKKNAKMLRIHSSSSLSSLSSSPSSSPKQKVHNTTKLSKSNNAKNIITNSTITTSSSMTFTRNVVSEKIPINSISTCCCCNKIDEISKHLHRIESLVAQPKSRALTPVVCF